MIWHITGSTIFKLFYWSQQSLVVANSGNPTWKGCCNSNKPFHKAVVVVQPCMKWIPIKKTFYSNIFYKLFKIYTNISLNLRSNTLLSIATPLSNWLRFSYPLPFITWMRVLRIQKSLGFCWCVRRFAGFCKFWPDELTCKIHLSIFQENMSGNRLTKIPKTDYFFKCQIWQTGFCRQDHRYK